MTLTLPIRLDPDSTPDDTLHVTVGGLPVRIYATDGGGGWPIHGAFFKDGKWFPLSWRSSGSRSSAGHASAFDLRDRPKAKRGVWVAWFEDENGTGCYAVARDSKEEASAPKYKFCLKGVTYLAQGDGLDTPADPPLWVDWAELPEWVKWAAADEEGCVWGYDKKPEEGDDAWCIRSNYRCIEIKSPPLYRLAPGFDWRKTLIQRPEGV